MTRLPQKQLIRWAAFVPISATADGQPPSFLSYPRNSVANGNGDRTAFFPGLWCMSCHHRTTELLLGFDVRLRCLLCHERLSQTIQSLQAGSPMQSRRSGDRHFKSQTPDTNKSRIGSLLRLLREKRVFKFTPEPS